MPSYPHVGLDLHEKTISYCVKWHDGEILDEGVLVSNRQALADWVHRMDGPWRDGDAV